MVGGAVKRNEEGVPRDCRKINTVSFFFFFHGRGKRGAKTKARTSYTACSNDSKKLVVWKRVSVGSSKTTLVERVSLESRNGSVRLREE